MSAIDALDIAIIVGVGVTGALAITRIVLSGLLGWS